MNHEKLRSIIETLGFKEYGFASLENPLSLEFYKSWIEAGQHGEMSYLERHTEVKAKPQLKYPKAKSAIVFRFHYYPKKTSDFALKATRVALYAQGADYHDELKVKLEPLLKALSEAFPEESFFFHTDSGPVLERDLAYKAGLGWFGKNTCMIDQKSGSLFFIAEILTSLDLTNAQALHPDRCGRCTRCIDACPTQAISGQGKSINAGLCISYLNIEKKGLPEVYLRERMQDWFFGCDICQTVCPWNEKVFGKKEMKEQTHSNSSIDTLTNELSMILSLSDSELKDLFKGTPLVRAKPKGLRRNAIIVATNKDLKALRPLIEKHKGSPDLADLVHWSLERL